MTYNSGMMVPQGFHPSLMVHSEMMSMIPAVSMCEPWRHISVIPRLMIMYIPIELIRLWIYNSRSFRHDIKFNVGLPYPWGKDMKVTQTWNWKIIILNIYPLALNFAAYSFTCSLFFNALLWVPSYTSIKKQFIYILYKHLLSF